MRSFEKKKFVGGSVIEYFKQKPHLWEGNKHKQYDVNCTYMKMTRFVCFGYFRPRYWE